MRLLLDTQVVLLWTTYPENLPAGVVTVLEDQGTTIMISTVSVWELAIKQASGKLELATGYFDDLLASQQRFLAMTAAHALAAARLPLHHRDPFDRMLIAQAQAERVPIVGSDRMFAAYDVDVFW